MQSPLLIIFRLSHTKFQLNKRFQNFIFGNKASLNQLELQRIVYRNADKCQKEKGCEKKLSISEKNFYGVACFSHIGKINESVKP